MDDVTTDTIIMVTLSEGILMESRQKSGLWVVNFCRVVYEPIVTKRNMPKSPSLAKCKNRIGEILIVIYSSVLMLQTPLPSGGDDQRLTEKVSFLTKLQNLVVSEHRHSYTYREGKWLKRIRLKEKPFSFRSDLCSVSCEGPCRKAAGLSSRGCVERHVFAVSWLVVCVLVDAERKNEYRNLLTEAWKELTATCKTSHVPKLLTLFLISMKRYELIWNN